MKIQLKTNWDAVTLKEYEQLTQILRADIPSDYKAVNLLATLSDQDEKFFEELPIALFTQLIPKIMFIHQEDIPEVKVKNRYEINGRRYELHAEIPAISTAQYIDYMSYIKEEPIDLQKVISVFLIPEGHKYNDGYDMKEVQADVHDMKIADVLAISFFMKKQYGLFIQITTYYLQKELKEMGMKKKQIKETVDPLKDMVSSHLYSK